MRLTMKQIIKFLKKMSVENALFSSQCLEWQ